MLIRPAVLDDLAGAVKMLTAAGLPLPGAFIAARIATTQGLTDPTVLLAAIDEDSGRVAGGVALEITPGLADGQAVGRVLILAVHPDFQRQGIARELMAAVERRAWARGCTRIEIAVGFHKPESRAFFGSLGYRVSGNRLVKRYKE